LRRTSIARARDPLSVAAPVDIIRGERGAWDFQTRPVQIFLRNNCVACSIVNSQAKPRTIPSQVRAGERGLPPRELDDLLLISTREASPAPAAVRVPFSAHLQSAPDDRHCPLHVHRHRNHPGAVSLMRVESDREGRIPHRPHWPSPWCRCRLR
jgi:hypothetical protein